jgi:hypothetical protein
MKKSILFISTLMLAIFFVACNDTPSTVRTQVMDSTAVVTDKDTSAMPAYDPAMDPLKVEAAFAKVLGDTLNKVDYRTNQDRAYPISIILNQSFDSLKGGRSSGCRVALYHFSYQKSWTGYRLSPCFLQHGVPEYFPQESLQIQQKTA